MFYIIMPLQIDAYSRTLYIKTVFLPHQSKFNTIMKIRNLLLVCLCSMNLNSMAQTISHSTQAIEADTKYFSDWTCTQLGSKFKAKQLNEFRSPLMKQLASDIWNGNYNAAYKVQQYKAIPSNKVLENAVKLTDGFSRYENITGIYLEKGEAVVLVGDLHGRTISLLIPDWNRQPTPGYAPTKDPNGWDLKCQEIALHEGANVIYVEKAGNVYLNYFANDPETAPEIKIHFPTGLVNGYFDSSIHTNEDWNRLLDNAVSPIMDARGKYMQIAYPVQYLKQFAYGKGTELLDNYDKIMFQQYTFMGATKYNRIPNKRILARVNYNYYMFRDGQGVAFLGDEKTMKMAIDEKVTTNWGVHHEIGHVMQMRPQMTWGGMTEVSNNLFAMFATKALGDSSRLSVRKIYDAAFKAVLDSGEKISILAVKDPFHKLVPFWQLHVYNEKRGYPEFYADLMEKLRQSPHAGKGDQSIHNMFEFMKLACDFSKTDFTDFFENWGFFVTGDMLIRDYADYHFTITPKMVEDVKTYIAGKGYPKPEYDITRLTD